MSSGRECELTEVRPNEWFYLLQSDFCSANAWDWREEDPYVGGPYPTEDACWEELGRRHANPGGYMAQALQPGVPEAVLSEAVREAIERHTRQKRPRERG